MQIQNVLMRSLVVVGIFASVIWTITDAEKSNSCCKLVSRAEVTDPIIGFSTQEADHPCVKAVIFKTEKGEFCSDWTQKWVLKKICQFLSAQRKKIAEERVIEHLTSPTPTTSITDAALVGRSTQELTQGSTQELTQGSTQELTQGSTQELTQGSTQELTQKMYS
ncbi:C-C motif chemokine 2-like [Xyrauchen texanus]|uniref:C-C motif chemokine 2-like n=1 Tax=Xyrauchen texanus TaxID=154827 RepID=UPI0022427EC2|nr:C-C motif chemokine 2-like [Xyrauchen texanus]XP_051969481.1 C-C motif chemokine 2-like [Xyrauchen texanus]XP_051969482.1 C-C motif chemokine 2-like [Xyrauchen texanus]